MSKVPTNNNTALAADSNPPHYLPTTPEAMEEGFTAPQSGGKFLPFMEMVFPVMATPEKPHYKGQDYKFGFVNGGKFEAFPVGTLITVFDKRNAARRGTHGLDERVYAYSAIERAGQQFNNTAELFNQLQAEARSDKSINVGYSFVVGVIFPGEEEKVAICDFSAFKTVAPYMFGPLSPALFAKKTALNIQIEDHTPNLAKSKTGNYYPDPKKFGQWKQQTLTPDQVKKLMIAFKEAEEGYMTWLGK